MEAVLAALEATGGNKSEASRKLGIVRKILHKKLQNLG
jgi:transcriptional regulator of acetoin/glycerol metabolism